MFCCSSHPGELITSLCQSPHCPHPQLCCSQCLRQCHHSHPTQSLRTLLPQLLQAHQMKQLYHQQLRDLVEFVEAEFRGEEGVAGVQVGNVVGVVKGLLGQWRSRVREEGRKIREIERMVLGKGSRPLSSSEMGGKVGEGGSEFRRYEGSSMPSTTGDAVDSFSLTLKHPYIALSANLRTATKSHSNGYKLAALSSLPLSQSGPGSWFHSRVIRSSGNILIGVAIQEIVRSKQYLNCYGSGHGTYLLGQNANNPTSAVLFHHADTMFNRKQIVGWNYAQGEALSVGLVKETDSLFVSFRKYQVDGRGRVRVDKLVKQFTMPLYNTKEMECRLHAVVLLQNEHDEVELLPHQQ